MAEADDILRRAYGDRDALRSPELISDPNPFAPTYGQEPAYRHEAKPYNPDPLTPAYKGAAEGLAGIARMPYDVGSLSAEGLLNSYHGRTGPAVLNAAELAVLLGGGVKGKASMPRVENPLRAYHGTDRQLKGGRFVESGPSGQGNFAHLDLDVPPDGVWFTDVPNRAAYFAKAAERNRGELGDPGTGQNIIPADLHFKNPYRHSAEMMADEGISSLPSIDELRRLGHDGVIVPRAKWSTEYKGYGAPTHEEQALQVRLDHASSERDRLAKEHGLEPGWYFKDTSRVEWDPVARHVSELDGQAHDLYKQIQAMEAARARSEPGPLRLIVDGHDYAAIAPDTVTSATTGQKLFSAATAPLAGVAVTDYLREKYGGKE